MRSFDYDVVIIGSGFGGSVAALRAAEKGYRVGVMEAGRRWKDEDIPKTNWNQKDYLWFHAAHLYGIQRLEYLDDVKVHRGAGYRRGPCVWLVEAASSHATHRPPHGPFEPARATSAHELRADSHDQPASR